MPDGVGHSLILNHLTTVQQFQTLRGSKPMAAQFIEREHDSPYVFLNKRHGREQATFVPLVFLVTRA